MIGNYVGAQLQSLNLGLSQPDGTQRIYPNYVRMQNKLYPQLCFDCENYTPDLSFDGPTGTAQIDVKIIAIDVNYTGANTLAQSVATALDATHGTWGGGLVVQGCFLDGVDEDHFVDTDLETILFYSKEMTFKVTYVIPA